MPLSFLKVGESGQIMKINGKDDVQRHLGNLGFVVGERISVVSELSGNVIVDIKGARVAIDKKMASRIMV